MTSSAKQGEYQYCQYIKYKDPEQNIWETVFCVLNTSAISIYPNNQSKEPIKTIRLLPSTSVSVKQYPNNNSSLLKIHLIFVIQYLREPEKQDTSSSSESSETDLSNYYYVELGIDDSESIQHWLTAFQTVTTLFKSLSISDFKIISVLGRGSYGKVMLAQRKSDGAYFAIKSIRKKRLIDENKIESITAERNILIRMNNPFIVHLHFAFQSETKIFLGLDYAAGGDLFYHMEQVGKVPVDDVRLYIAELAIALNYIHSLGIVYRDVKPENVMLDGNGHILLTDFGLSKDLAHTKDKRTNTFCGTADYLAPEIVKGEDYSFEVDWWALAVLCFEMLTATSPFFHRNKKRLLDNIVNSSPQLKLVTDQDAASWISFMLVKDPKMRPGFKEIKQHPFFKSLNWDDVMNKKCQPGYVPETGIKSLNNFNPEFTTEVAHDSFSEFDVGNTFLDQFSFADITEFVMAKS